MRGQRVRKTITGVRDKVARSRFAKPAVFIVAFALVGVVALTMTKAATPTASFQAESGTRTGNAAVATDTSASGSAAVKFTNTPTSCGVGTVDLSCWPNASNTGYQNAPGYPGTPGVADPSKLRTAKAGDAQCPTTFQSGTPGQPRVYSFCHYTGSGHSIGSQIASYNRIYDAAAQNYHVKDQYGDWYYLHDVKFLGSLFDNGELNVFCVRCSFDYVTVKPSGITAPNVPGKHGVLNADSYGGLMNAGTGAYYSFAPGLTITHSDFWGWQTGIILGGGDPNNPVLIQDNWLHDQGQCMEAPGCLTHADGIGMVDTGYNASYVTINHNNMPFITDNTNNIAFQEGTYDRLTITNNIFSGDGYTVAIWDTSKNIIFTGNVMTNYAQHYFGWNYGKNFWDTPGSCWARNKFVWDPTGANPYYTGGPGLGNYGPITQADSGKFWVPSGLSTTDYKNGAC